MPDFDLHPDMQELYAAKKALTATGDPEVLRRDWQIYEEKLSRPYPAGMVVTNHVFPWPGAGRDGTIEARIYRPAEAGENPPCVLFVHGGGFVKGSIDSADSNAWGVADETGAVVISVNYRLAPEFIYPFALTDVYEALRYVQANAEALGVDGARIAMWGESAGANLVAGTTLFSRDKGGPKPVAQVLIYGPYSDELTLPSYRIHANSVPGMSTDESTRTWPMYLGGQPAEETVYATPLKAKDLSGLPPTFLHYAEIDPCADSSPAYAQRLVAAGVPTTLRCAKGMIHGFIRARFAGTTAASEFTLPCMYLRGIFASVAG
jgi:acetyl esterase